MNEVEQTREQVKDGSSLIRKYWLFCNTDLLYPLAGILAGGFIIWTTNLGMPKTTALVLCPMPLFCILTYFFIFVFNRPPHYAEDCAEKIMYGKHFDPSSQKYSHLPNGMFGKNLIIWNDMSTGYWSAALDLNVPSIDYASNGSKNAHKDRFDKFLRFCAQEGLRTQYFWSVTSDYSSELQSYAADTDILPESPCKEYRKERHKVYHEKMMNRQLRRERLILFISKKLLNGERVTLDLPNDVYAHQTATIETALEESAIRQLQRLNNFLEPCGIVGKVLTTQDIMLVMASYMNPSHLLAPQMFSGMKVNGELSIKEQIVYSDISESQTAGFKLDGQHHAVFVLRNPLPNTVYLGMINELTRLNILDYSISATVVPRDIKTELNAEETAIGKLENQLATGKAPISVEVALNQRKDFFREMSSGKISPMDCQYIITVHDSDPEEIQIKATIIKSALIKISIGFYLLDDGKQATNAFFQGLPGWLWGKRPKHSFKTLDKYLSCILPCKHPVATRFLL